MARMRTGFVTSNALREKINPAMFDQTINILLYSETRNALGEIIKNYTTSEPIRALIKEMQSSDEMLAKDNTNISLMKVAKLWAWYDERMLDNRNKILWNGEEYTVVDCQEVYGRKRFIFNKIVQYI